MRILEILLKNTFEFKCTLDMCSDDFCTRYFDWVFVSRKLACKFKIQIKFKRNRG